MVDWLVIGLLTTALAIIYASITGFLLLASAVRAVRGLSRDQHTEAAPILGQTTLVRHR